MEAGISLAEDSVLDPEVFPKGDAKTLRLSEASSILVTGATGFLGAFLLDELLRNTPQNTRIYCLARNQTPGQGTPVNRALENLRFYGLEGESEGHRIVPVEGDLAQPHLGLEDEDYQRTCG